MKVRKGCWTCAARKVQCDGDRPACKKCVRSRRECQGYELRLSWPRAGDKKRALTGTNTPPAISLPHRSIEVPSGLFFVNTSFKDLELYGYLTGQTTLYQPLGYSPNLSRQHQQYTDHMDLIHYFYHTAYLSLVTFGQEPSHIRGVLLSMALSHDAVSGVALFYALLAFSSLHRHGLDKQGLNLKIQAIQFLSAAVKSKPLTAATAAQHVAASMLLGSFEIMQPLEGSGEWLWHTWGAMDMIRATQLNDQPHGSDTGHLLNWVQYHEVISRFTMHHWRHKSLVPMKTRKASTIQNLQYLPLARHRPNLPSANPTYAILNLLSEVCDTLIDPRDPRSQDEEYRLRLKDIERRIESLSIQSDTTESTPDAIFAVGLYQMATRVYLVRASQSPWEATANLDSLIDAAFSGPARSCTCEHFFPLLILACEAQKDEQRVTIINLIERTARDERIRSIQAVKTTIQSIWVQQDLHKDNDVLIDYLDIMSAVISSNNSVPSFA
ncbi:uncharacterized protein CTRU02_200864 [Colletotrichum truncatum]|uniref:Uncharacterized protein n=1 Tax=Colletotrichum truncatum TaxID=5467 RepID=A0ACC3ZGC0_COLTU